MATPIIKVELVGGYPSNISAKDIPSKRKKKDDRRDSGGASLATNDPSQSLPPGKPGRPPSVHRNSLKSDVAIPLSSQASPQNPTLSGKRRSISSDKNTPNATEKMTQNLGEKGGTISKEKSTPSPSGSVPARKKSYTPSPLTLPSTSTTATGGPPTPKSPASIDQRSGGIEFPGIRRISVVREGGTIVTPTQRSGTTTPHHSMSKELSNTDLNKLIALGVPERAILRSASSQEIKKMKALAAATSNSRGSSKVVVENIPNYEFKNMTVFRAPSQEKIDTAKEKEAEFSLLGSVDNFFEHVIMKPVRTVVDFMSDLLG